MKYDFHAKRVRYWPGKVVNQSLHKIILKEAEKHLCGTLILEIGPGEGEQGELIRKANLAYMAAVTPKAGV